MAPKTYLNFDLHIHNRQDSYHVHVQNSPVGQATALCGLVTSDECAALMQSIDDMTTDLQVLGQRLFAMLFHGEIHNCLMRSLTRAQEQGCGLRIRLRCNDAPELATLPWEYLHGPAPYDYFCLSDQTPIVRYLELAQAEAPLTVQRPLRILVVLADPIDIITFGASLEES